MPRGERSRPFVEMPWPAGGDGRHLHLGVNLSDSSLPLRPGSPHVLGPGDLVVWGTVPPAGDLAEEVAFFRVPRFLLDVPEEALRCAPVIRVDGGDGLAECVSLFLSALARTSRHRVPAVGGRLALNTADLVALLLTEVQESAGAGALADPAHELLARVQTHIRENLADSSMSPDSIARAHHISVRYLHKLFRTSGTTVGAWIRQHRLAACRLELRRRRRSVAVVAQSWGFTSPSHFSRVFRQTYGLSPKQWQNSVL